MIALLPWWLAEILVVVGALTLIVLAIGAVAARFDRDKSLDWAVRHACPGCDARYEAWQGNAFFLRFEICPECGADKKDFKPTDCMREADGEWVDRGDLEAVARELMGD